MMICKKVIGILVLVFLSGITKSEIKLPAIMGDQMVLQQQSLVNLWGQAAASHRVTITTSWNNRQYDVQSNANGNWEVKVITPEAGGPFTITFDDGQKLTLFDILIGEVWFCSGQSNMEMPVKGFTNNPILNSNNILAEAGNTQVRLFQVKNKTSNVPLADCEGGWEISSPEVAANFSAVGFQFAQKLNQILKVPVGIIQADWGGTPIKAWMDYESLKTFPKLVAPGEDSHEALKSNVLFNGMINPIVGYGIKGFLWYQGENDTYDPYLYKDLMKAMVQGWRRLWQKEDLSFYYVQIAPYSYPENRKDSVPLVREAQMFAMKEIPHSGMIVSMDIGAEHNIHPADKTTIANRLFYWALGDTYGVKGISYRSPVFDVMEIDGNKVRISLTPTPLGLTSFEKEIVGFEIAGKDQKFYPAKARILSGQNKGKVEVESDRVRNPVAVRYLFKDWVEGNLYGNDGLPVSPFRTDDWSL